MNKYDTFADETGDSLYDKIRDFEQEKTLGLIAVSATIVNEIEAAWLKVKSVQEMPESIFLELDAGERDVIALALSEQTTRIVLDEKRARKVAQSLKLNVIGTLGILMLAKQNQIIPNVKPLLDAMMTEAQYWVNESLYDNVLQAVSEDEIE
ncbi:DUF3368 domain-containing protein [Phormidium yuhuli AB48]|uniref:DUF3368 domain-containing protein n=1 Tax=Phormidium yuhuli AB48 TaxID=2940671 RepID=A0ABY5AM28_9CYAN|nr:DUF3368 domain-containing protein [Phormidium yuhuli]USR90255.1 DUF3368 domain-containing protein [Phormidium yuhuli AB48]